MRNLRDEKLEKQLEKVRSLLPTGWTASESFGISLSDLSYSPTFILISCPKRPEALNVYSTKRKPLSPEDLAARNAKRREWREAMHQDALRIAGALKGHLPKKARISVDVTSIYVYGSV